jgi:hypothetical protein
MKKSIVIAALLFIGFYSSVMAGSEPACYVKTAENVYFGQKLKIGLLKTTVIAEDGKTLKVPNHDVLSYMNGSKLFELLPLADNDPETPDFVLMECIAVRSGLKLYSYSNPSDKDSGKEYFVYKDGNLHVRTDRNNASNILMFFGIKSL